ncbi:hypothetical protein ANCCAN_23754 [Ancylostoma caninum]|uniref:Uncharacterized protein n=1 Tax=Ancylostoma caninum TaxID=29170 RepID=A0A368FE53_ANCCA|nr:hypothetical protein ANCCAN_23754 [Ancylostoma caninum]
MGTAMIMEDITMGMTTVGMEVGTITAGEVEGEDVIGMNAFTVAAAAVEDCWAS